MEILCFVELGFDLGDGLHHEQCGRDAFARDIADQEDEAMVIDVEIVIQVSADVFGKADGGINGNMVIVDRFARQRGELDLGGESHLGAVSFLFFDGGFPLFHIGEQLRLEIGDVVVQSIDFIRMLAGIFPERLA